MCNIIYIVIKSFLCNKEEKMKFKILFLILSCVFILFSCSSLNENVISNEEDSNMNLNIDSNTEINAEAVSEQNSADPIYQLLMDNSFEVVVDKLESEKIQYEKPLPFQRIDYKIRNDKYIPIGTAFLLEDGYFYTAEHVLNLPYRTMFENMYIRDKNGSVYPIDKIYSFSTHADYVCFSVKDYDVTGKGLKIADSIDLNSYVLSVGNALGDGIIIRDGVYTSSTPENYEGAWSWLRFSAAANPGNSGGPLVKADGSVIGIILMVNNTQNLNYAVPITEVLKGVREQRGEVDERLFSYLMPNIINEKIYKEIRQTFTLPLGLNELRQQVSELYDNASKECVEEIREQFEPTKEKSFDTTRGSAETLFYENDSATPMVMYRTSAGLWEVGYLSDMSTSNLKNNGYLKEISEFNSTFYLLKKPDDVKLQELIDNPELAVKYILEGTTFYRTVAGEKIEITSFGEPAYTDKYVDYFGRTWIVSYFTFDFSDQMVVTFALPIPGGALVISQIATYGEALNCISLDMEFLADCTLISYKAKLKDWKEYLALTGDMVRTSDFESSISIETKNKGIKVSASDKLLLDLPSDVIEINDESEITISFSYRKSDDGNLSLDVSSISLQTPAKTEQQRSLYWGLIKKPNDDALDTTQDVWFTLVNKISPFNGEPYDEGKDTTVSSVFIPKGFNAENTPYVYFLSFTASCGNDKNLVKLIEKKIESCLKVF